MKSHYEKCTDKTGKGKRDCLADDYAILQKEAPYEKRALQ